MIVRTVPRILKESQGPTYFVVALRKVYDEQGKVTGAEIVAIVEFSEEEVLSSDVFDMIMEAFGC